MARHECTCGSQCTVLTLIAPSTLHVCMDVCRKTEDLKALVLGLNKTPVCLTFRSKPRNSCGQVYHALPLAPPLAAPAPAHLKTVRLIRGPTPHAGQVRIRHHALASLALFVLLALVSCCSGLVSALCCSWFMLLLLLVSHCSIRPQPSL